MGKPNFSDEFKRDAVAQITERGYPVAEVSPRLSVSQHSLYAWKRQLATQVSGHASKDAEIRRLKRELARVAEERDILKRMARPVRKRFVKDGMMVCINVSGSGGPRLVEYDLPASGPDASRQTRAAQRRQTYSTFVATRLAAHHLTGDYLWTDPDARSAALRPLRMGCTVEGPPEP